MWGVIQGQEYCMQRKNMYLQFTVLLLSWFLSMLIKEKFIFFKISVYLDFTDRFFLKNSFYHIPAIWGIYEEYILEKKTYLPGEFWLNMMKFWIIDGWITFSPLQIEIFFHHAFFWLLLINFSSQSQSTVQSFYGDIGYSL